MRRGKNDAPALTRSGEGMSVPSMIEKYPFAAALAVVLASCVLGVLLGLLAFHLVNP